LYDEFENRPFVFEHGCVGGHFENRSKKVLCGESWGFLLGHYLDPYGGSIARGVELACMSPPVAILTGLHPHQASLVPLHYLLLFCFTFVVTNTPPSL